jgi:hypothetical protein
MRERRGSPCTAMKACRVLQAQSPAGSLIRLGEIADAIGSREKAKGHSSGSLNHNGPHRVATS